MDSGQRSDKFNQVSNSPLDQWHIEWLLSDAPRSPGEAIDRVKKIQLATGKSAADAALQLAEDIRTLSERQEAE